MSEEIENPIPQKEISLLRVKTTTDVRALSGSIINSFTNEPSKPIVLRAIGAGAVNQAVKAALTSNQFFNKQSLEVALLPSMCEIKDQDRPEVTGVELRIEIRPI